MMRISLREMDPKRRALTLVAWATLITAPFLQFILIFLVTGKNGMATYPVWSDEMDYWRNLFVWLEVGFSSGYNGIGEFPPVTGTLSVHGLTPLLLYGGMAKVFGLTYHSIAIYNAVWVSVAALVFCLLVRPKALHALLLATLLILFMPSLLYAPTSMTEQFNYALLLLYLAFLLRHQRTESRTPLWLCWATVVFACLYRISYLVLFIPLVWIASGRRFGKKLGLNVLVAVMLSAASYWIGASITAPFPSGFLYNWVRIDDVRTFIQMFLSHAKGNLYDYFLRYTDSPLEDVLRVVYCGLMGLCMLLSFVRIGKREGRIRLNAGVDWTVFGCFLMLLLPFGIVVALYETNDWSDFRTLAPFLWGTSVALVMQNRKFLSGVSLAGTVWMLILLLSISPVGAYVDEYRFERQPSSQHVKDVCAQIIYDPDAQDPFANTIRTDLSTLDVLTEVDPHMGLLYGWFTQENTGKSRWILTDHLKIVLTGYQYVDTQPGASAYRHAEGPRP